MYFGRNKYCSYPHLIKIQLIRVHSWNSYLVFMYVINILCQKHMIYSQLTHYCSNLVRIILSSKYFFINTISKCNALWYLNCHWLCLSNKLSWHIIHPQWNHSWVWVDMWNKRGDYNSNEVVIVFIVL